MHIVHVVGARPQFIKLSVVCRALRARFAQDGALRQTIIHTGQHFDDDMSAVFFDELDIPRPDVNLGVHSLSHGAMTGRSLEQLEAEFQRLAPDLVLIYGDTNATLAGALGAAKLGIRIGHVEAGLRSFIRTGPEEINRVVADRLSDLLYVPTPTARDNLLAEGMARERIHLVGDVMFDCARQAARIADNTSRILERLALTTDEFVLCTVHRAENTDDAARLGLLLSQLERVAERTAVVLPLHPRTRGLLARHGLTPSPAIRLIEPVGYLDMVRLERSAAVIATDSGGVQREAYFHGKPAVVFRERSEWVELIESGWTEMVPLAPGCRLAETILRRIGERGAPIDAFGDGAAAGAIADTLVDR